MLDAGDGFAAQKVGAFCRGRVANLKIDRDLNFRVNAMNRLEQIHFKPFFLGQGSRVADHVENDLSLKNLEVLDVSGIRQKSFSAGIGYRSDGLEQD